MSKKRHDRAAEAESGQQPGPVPVTDGAVQTPADDVAFVEPTDGEVDPQAGAGLDGTDAEVARLHGVIADLHTQIASMQTEIAEQVDRRLRVAAELDNLRKRSRREVHDARRFAQADLLRPLLEVLDNFERALQFTTGEPDGAAADGPQASPADNDAYRQGVALIAQRFRQVLTECGVRRIETEGRVFDPAQHEAVGQAPAPAGAESGAILAEVQSGYTFDDLVLRASRVIVAQ